MKTGKSKVREESVMRELEDVTENVSEVFHTDILHVLYLLLKGIVEGRWKKLALWM